MTQHQRTVCFPYSGATIGGSHISSLLLAEELIRRGENVRIVLHEAGLLVDYLDQKGLPYTILPAPLLKKTLNPWMRIPCLSRNLTRLCRFISQNQITHVHGNDSPINTYWSIATKLSGRRYIWHHRGQTWGDYFKRVPWGRRRCDAIISVSEFAREVGPRHLQQYVRVIYNPVAIPPSDASARAAIVGRHRLPEDTAIVGYVGNFIFRKRPDMFVQIAGEIHRKLLRPCAFIMLGNDYENKSDSLRQEARAQGIEDMLFILGFRFDTDMYYNAFDVLLSPSIREPYGRTLVEAMCANTPVVAARSGGHIELIEEGRTGFLVEPDDLDKFAHTTIRLLRDKTEYASIASSARKFAASRHDLQAHVDQVIQVYDSLSVGI